MIAIVFYAILAGLIVIAAFISNRLIKIFGWSLSPNKFFLLHAGVFVGILCILFFDHIIGVIQFKYVCHNKTKTMLSENWKKVQSAKLRTKKNRLRGFIVPVSCTEGEYYDVKDGRAFLSYISCEREGGVVYRKLTWDNYFSSDRCYPKKLDNIEDMIDLETLLQKGKEDE